MSRTVFGEVVWGRLPKGGVAHAFDTGEASETSLCGLVGLELRVSDARTDRMAKCRRCVLAQIAPFAVTEAELSDEARAILAYARKWGSPFSRLEITDIAPGAAWDPHSRWPSTVAKLDPIRELVRAGLVAEHDEVSVKGSKGTRAYKRWVLTTSVPSLADLLDAFAEATLSYADAEDSSTAESRKATLDQVRSEILHRFGRG